MSCANVKCSSKSISRTLRLRCCGKGGGITPASKQAGKSQRGATRQDFEEEQRKKCDCNLIQLGLGYKCVNGKCQKSLLETALGDKKSQGSAGSLFRGKQEQEEIDDKNDGDDDTEKEDKGENLSDTDKDCTDFWGNVPIISWIIPESSRESMCVASKSTQKGYKNCGGLPVDCGTLAIGVGAIILLILVLKGR